MGQLRSRMVKCGSLAVNHGQSGANFGPTLGPILGQVLGFGSILGQLLGQFWVNWGLTVAVAVAHDGAGLLTGFSFISY